MSNLLSFLNKNTPYNVPQQIRHYFIILLFIIISISFAQFSPVMSSNTQEIHTFLTQGNGSVNAKLVYVHYSNTDATKKLCYIDFSEEIETPVVHTIATVEEARLPVISPDGNWVVYATGEGAETGSPVSNRSSVYLCKIEEDATPVLVAADSACEPRFIYSSEKLTVVYPTLAPNYGWEGFGKTMKVEIDVSSGTPVVGTPEIIFEHGSYTGGLSWDGKYLCGGGGDIVMLDLTSGNTKPDTVSSFAQSCNASISSSAHFTNTMMHLTMTGSHPIINGGKSWSSWQTVLINNNQGDILQGYWYPTEYKYTLQTDPESFTEGYARWHHCEWSNHPYFAVAALNADRYYPDGSDWVNTYYQERLYLINLKDSLYLEILRPDTIQYSGIPGDNSGFHWPGLWIKIPDGFTEDTTWLVPSTGISVNQQMHNDRQIFSLKNNRIYSETGITSIALYQTNGKCLYSSSLPPKTKSIHLSQLNRVGKGVYLIQVKGKSDVVSTFRFIKMY